VVHVFVDLLGVPVLAQKTSQHTQAPQPQHLEQARENAQREINPKCYTLKPLRSRRMTTIRGIPYDETKFLSNFRAGSDSQN